MTIAEATVEVLRENNLQPFLSVPHDFTTVELREKGINLSAMYSEIAAKVNPEWRHLITNDRIAFDKFWKLIDNEIEAHGYYMLGEKHDTPLLAEEKAEPQKSTAIPDAELQKSLDDLKLRYATLWNENTDTTAKMKSYKAALIKIAGISAEAIDERD